MRILHQAQSSRVMVANARENNNHLNHGSKIKRRLQLDCHGSRIVVNMTPKKRWTGVTEGKEGEKGGGRASLTVIFLRYEIEKRLENGLGRAEGEERGGWWKINRL